MKKIFVSVAELQENNKGGYLSALHNRDVYISRFGGDLEFTGKFMSMDGDTVTYDNWDTHSTEYLTADKNHIFIEIETTPIWL